MPGGDEVSQQAFSATMKDKRLARANPFYSLGKVAAHIATIRKTGAYMKGPQKALAQSTSARLNRIGSSGNSQGRLIGTGIGGAKRGFAPGSRRLAMSAADRQAQGALASARATMTAGQITRARVGLGAAAKRGQVPAYNRR